MTLISSGNRSWPFFHIKEFPEWQTNLPNRRNCGLDTMWNRSLIADKHFFRQPQFVVHQRWLNYQLLLIFPRPSWQAAWHSSLSIVQRQIKGSTRNSSWRSVFSAHNWYQSLLSIASCWRIFHSRPPMIKCLTSAATSERWFWCGVCRSWSLDVVSCFWERLSKVKVASLTISSWQSFENTPTTRLK